MAEEVEAEDLAERIAALREMPNAFQFDQAVARRTAPDRAAELASMLPVRPEGAGFPAAALAAP